MAEWWIQRETPPGGGIYLIQNTVPVQPDAGEGSVSNVGGIDVYQDGYPNDFSGWGQEESDRIQDYLYDCSMADPTHPGVSYAATWIGVINPDPGTEEPQGLMSAKAVVPKTVLIVRSSKDKRHKTKKPKKH